MKKRELILFCILLFCFLSFVRAEYREEKGVNVHSNLILNVNLLLNRKVYDHSDYGEPPQLAIWIEDLNENFTNTLYVTRRTAENDWNGKARCPVSLPYWEKRSSDFRNQIDAVSMATEKETIFVSHPVKAGSEFYIFIEVNTAGDYNRSFPAYFDDGTPDPQGNGQPSLVFSYKIKALPGETGFQRRTGRTHQIYLLEELIYDLKGIDSATKIFSNIEINIIPVRAAR